MEFNEQSNGAGNGPDVVRLIQMRAMTIQFLKSLEDELIAMGLLMPDDRACLTRQERRALVIVTTSIDNRPMGGV